MVDTENIAASGRVAFDPGDGYGYMHMGDSWGYGLHVILLILLLVALGIAVYLIVRAATGGHSAPSSGAATSDATASARATLAQRLAEGDIEIDDYRARVAELDGPDKPPRGKKSS